MSDLDRLFYWRGIAKEYRNYRGELVQVPIQNRLNLLKAMNVDVKDERAIKASADELDVGPWRHFFPPLQTCRIAVNESAHFFVNLHPALLSEKLHWKLVGDGGVVADSGAVKPEDAPELGDYVYKGNRYSRRKIHSAVSTPGYYTLNIGFPTLSASKLGLLNDGGEAHKLHALLAVAPIQVFQPAWLIEGDSPWGFIIQLYTIRTDGDWGIGDFSDLQLLTSKAAALGADVIGLNPLHVLLPDVEAHNSPYSPSDRRFINPLYIDPTNEPDFLRSNSLHSAESKAERKARLGVLRDRPSVNYSAVKNLKYPVFEAMFKQFISDDGVNHGARWDAFQAFVRGSGVPLKQFALYEAARNHWVGSEYRADISDDVLIAAPNSEVFRGALGLYEADVLFHSYLQWLAHQQLGACQAHCEALGMKVGLVRDLAVGADGGGAEAFSNPDQFCQSVSVGAPPDPLAEQGQNWGLPPMDPAHLRSTGYAHFIQILRENMSRCGALRIDHAMSLMRLWWCPPGKTADYGAYVYYPFDDMLALLCLESYRNECAIIGEDLGVVPDEFRDAINAAGIFSNRVFYFEREHYTAFKSPEYYDEHALAMVNNHDVPTLKSWWDGTDLLLRDRLNIFEEGVNYALMVEQRSRDKKEVLDFLDRQHLLPRAWSHREVSRDADVNLIFSILKAVSRVRSKLFVIQLEDVLLMDEPVNVPGTYKEYPNWQRKICKSVEDIFDCERTILLLKEIDAQRRNRK
ncbi:4-alpha-glucanotransferase [Teredinibacter purpureus]|uniref:4-alpha-glucanotransferase n=1 Tax=Teredinibacter purpureus TaxID=2731756 RepID=UPI0005F7E221|nr:4-alpha-glucanotransferase [Teredinibacter purpureus]